ncbi:AAA family ATPase [Spirochaetales bacterium BR193]|uniref:(d)CMP kinase n=2 Tax=Entomospira TaxID=2834378 RepID=A0A968KSU3_9SPIO|nr:AAA family ATPase [Entomospira entomophilus]NIZ46756.1 AAA family ATPase [Entomospira nematocera]
MRIAMSGRSGCGNTTAGRLVADRLGINHVNYTFRNLAKDKGISFNELRHMAQESDEIDKELDRHQLELAITQSCVLSSRLAIWMLPVADLKIFLNIPLDERSRRIAQREGGDIESKIAETQQRDVLDHQRYYRIYGIDTNRFDSADIIINSGRLNASQVADIIISAIPRDYFASK